jgi:uncharacterized protein
MGAADVGGLGGPPRDGSAVGDGGSLGDMVDRERWERTFRDGWVAEGAGDPAHDLGHVERVVRAAMELAEVEGARADVVLPAAWLHDCVHVPKDSADRNLRTQASRLAADRAVRLLRGWGYPEEELPAIHHAVVAHSFSAGVPPMTIEAKVLQDADRLDALGAIGLGRFLMLGGAMGKPFASPDDPFCREREPDDERFVLDHLFAKLLSLEEMMATESGKRLAAERTLFLRDYLRQLEREL